MVLPGFGAMKSTKLNINDNNVSHKDDRKYIQFAKFGVTEKKNIKKIKFSSDN